jgi:hypothetical protein
VNLKIKFANLKLFKKFLTYFFFNLNSCIFIHDFFPYFIFCFLRILRD